MIDTLRQTKRLCREREGTTVAGWRFTRLQATASLHPMYVLFEYRREPIAPAEGFPLYIKVTRLYARDDLLALLRDPEWLGDLVPDAERAEVAATT
jgi:hypothetical protein